MKKLHFENILLIAAACAITCNCESEPILYTLSPLDISTESSSAGLTNLVIDEETWDSVERLCTNLWANFPVRPCFKYVSKPDIEVLMDEIDEDDNKVSATGVRAAINGNPGPSSQLGKFGRSIFLPNHGTYDDNYITLGRHRNRCVDNLHMCKDGLTVSLWFLMDDNNHEWPVLISATGWQIWTHKISGNYEPYLTFFKSNSERYVMSEDHKDLVRMNEWHHVAFVYRNDDNVKFYIDGRLIETVNKFDRNMTRRNKSIQIGCHFDGNCARAKFDELEIWELAKSDEDITKIYNHGECPAD